ncbi:hypothetical protein ARALYDRAFT_482686 [Arabidopsis lyrata subsp. lyrata]|uniref:Uncharacterized protein n=1 Tax=Arabidopsis lyrata subsp. lyrata TaxID=81972 RepID=D7LJB3_ARALL|nr:hypothetical protein ARALYDRAFT_482686 [Arabidopsis lyrata subsp. lyrata]
MGPFGMDTTPEFPDTFAGFKSGSVDEILGHSMEDKMSDMKHFLMDPNHDNTAVNSFLGLGMENMGLSTKIEEFSHGFDFSFLPDYGGLNSYSTKDVEAGLKFDILDGFLDGVDEVEDIYASHDLSSIGNHFLPETEVKKKVSELDGDPYGLVNLSSESFSPGISGSIGLSEWSKETVPHAESQNVSSEKFKDSLDSNGSEDDKKPLSTFIGSWVKRGKNRKKNLLNTACRRLDSSRERMSCVSYDFRPRKGPMKKYIHTSTENTFSQSYTPILTRSDRRKNQRMWTVDEVMKLVDGISHFGVGKWTDIKNHFFHSAAHRTPVDIRDKWRNLLKASYNDREAEEKRKSVARSIPKEILHRVRELASLHPYPFSKSSCFVHDSSRSRSTSRKKKKRS